MGSVAELVVATELTKRRIAFDYWPPDMGARPDLGIRADFILYDATPQAVWNLEPDQGMQQIQRRLLEDDGYLVVFLKEEDVIARPTETVRAALAGEMF